MMKEIMQMNITWLNILTQKKKTSLFTYKRGRGFELGSTDKRLQLSGESGIEPVTFGLQVRRSNHSLTLLPPHCVLYSLLAAILFTKFLGQIWDSDR